MEGAPYKKERFDRMRAVVDNEIAKAEKVPPPTNIAKKDKPAKVVPLDHQREWEREQEAREDRWAELQKNNSSKGGRREAA